MRGPAGAAVGSMRRVILSDITGASSAGSARIGAILAGIPGHPIEDLKVSDVILVNQGGGTKNDAQLLLPEKENQYPEPNMFGTTPAHGIFIRHVKGLEMNGVKIDHLHDDARPAFVLEDVEGAEFGRIKAAADAGIATFWLRRVKDFSVFRSRPVADTELGSVQEKEI